MELATMPAGAMEAAAMEAAAMEAATDAATAAALRPTAGGTALDRASRLAAPSAPAPSATAVGGSTARCRGVRNARSDLSYRRPSDSSGCADQQTGGGARG